MTHLSTPRDFLRVFRAYKFTVLLITLIAVAVAVAYSAVRKRVYDATATIQFMQQTDIGVFVPGVQTPVDVSPTTTAAANSQIVTRQDVLRSVGADTGLSTATLRGAVNVSVQPNSNLIAITTSTQSAARSAQVANAFARETQQAVQSDVRRTYGADAAALNRALRRNMLDPATRTAYQQAISRVSILSQVAAPVQVVRAATVPSAPSSPNPVRDILLALVLGLVIGTGAAFGRNALDRRFRDVPGVEQELGLPLVGYVPAEALGLTTNHRNGTAREASHLEETFRVLRTNMAFLAPDHAISTVAVTSAVAEEGKSTVGAWYASVSAAAGTRTLIVDCDFRKPRLAARLGVDSKPGLSDYLAGGAAAGDVVRVVDVQGPDAVPLSFIPAGSPLFQPAETIASRKFRQFVREIADVYELVIFDTAPLLPVSDTLQLIPQIDAIVLCVRIGQTTRTQAHAAKGALSHLPTKPTGVVVTSVTRGDDYYYYGDYPVGASRVRGEPTSG